MVSVPLVEQVSLCGRDSEVLHNIPVAALIQGWTTALKN